MTSMRVIAMASLAVLFFVSLFMFNRSTKHLTLLEVKDKLRFITACTIVMNEPYIQEYIIHTLHIGYSHIVIIDLNTDPVAEGITRQLVQPWIDEGTVTYEKQKDHTWRAKCAEREAKVSRWVSVQDCDEFLSINAGRSLEEILLPFEKDSTVGGVAVHWKMNFPLARFRKGKRPLSASQLMGGFNENVKTLMKTLPDKRIAISLAHPAWFHYCSCSSVGLRLVNSDNVTVSDLFPEALRNGAKFGFGGNLFFAHYSFRGSVQGLLFKASRGEPYYHDHYLKSYISAGITQTAYLNSGRYAEFVSHQLQKYENLSLVEKMESLVLKQFLLNSENDPKKRILTLFGKAISSGLTWDEDAYQRDYGAAAAAYSSGLIHFIMQEGNSTQPRFKPFRHEEEEFIPTKFLLKREYG